MYITIAHQLYVVYLELATRETAQRLKVHPSRVRALIGSGGLRARRVGSQWLVDADSVDRHAALIAGRATGRSMSPRIAWAAAAHVDGIADGLAASERYRIRRRLAGSRPTVETVQRWLSRRSDDIGRYRVGERDIPDLLASADVVASGVSAASHYGLGLGVGGAGDAYVSSQVRDRLVRDYALIPSDRGNLTLRVVDQGWHLATATAAENCRVAPRLITGVDLVDDADARTRRSGRAFDQRGTRLLGQVK
ncbi:excisionase family DNA-binding protein [Mycobacterium riyadhense]|uniref:excisionase family DNA-binding protein n=1 Tax=Mycobacterium riyadhense TaxID=486698 RepID=UPI00195196EE|nr:excisionase family DNA-binding protein [Mycobacterium riyadhense]